MNGTSPSRIPETTAAPERGDRSLRAVVLLAFVALIARIGYLVWFCRYDLVEDEAHYWLWSRSLDWSYYSKGPGVAWAIWLSTKLLGNAEWAVRLPTAVAGAIGTLAAGALARDLAADAEDRARAGVVAPERGAWASPARVGLAAALAYVLTPALQGASILMTIDGPYVACWSVACWGFWRAWNRGETKLWPLVGAAVALGFLFKYTMLLLIPGLVVFAIVDRVRRERGAKTTSTAGGPWLAAGVLLALAGLLPVVLWNAKNGWPTVQHLLGHLGVAGGDVPLSAGERSKWSPMWLPELICEQLGMIGPWLVLAGAGAWQLWTNRSSRAGASAQDPRRAGRVFLALAAAPILVFYAIVALIAEPEGNWPMAACATLMPLAAWMGADALEQRDAARRRGEPPPWGRGVRLRVRLWRAGVWYGLVAALLLHKLDWAGDAELALDRQPWFHGAYCRLLRRDPAKPESRVRDIAGRLRGAKELSAHVAELLDGLERSEKMRPFVIAAHYGRASQIAYYLRGRPGLDVLCAMQQTGGRRSQFDFWPQTRLDRTDLIGRPAVIVTSTRAYMSEEWRTMFARVEPIPGEQLRGESKPDRSALLGYGWKGPPGPAVREGGAGS